MRMISMDLRDIDNSLVAPERSLSPSQRHAWLRQMEFALMEELGKQNQRPLSDSKDKGAHFQTETKNEQPSAKQTTSDELNSWKYRAKFENAGRTADIFGRSERDRSAFAKETTSEKSPGDTGKADESTIESGRTESMEKSPAERHALHRESAFPSTGMAPAPYAPDQDVAAFQAVGPAVQDVVAFQAVGPAAQDGGMAQAQSRKTEVTMTQAARPALPANAVPSPSVQSKAASAKDGASQKEARSRADKGFSDALDEWKKRTMHVQTDGSMVNVTIRDGGLSALQSQNIVYRLASELNEAGHRLRTVIVNGRLAYRSESRADAVSDSFAFSAEEPEAKGSEVKPNAIVEENEHGS
ncbi:MAG TPA: hypothetical protein VEC06_08795 [Paucimonas sp.]|nr:hypothetical protein [Paucimonas sp.]